MRKIAIWTLGGALLALFTLPGESADKRGDLRVIKKAVQENSTLASGHEAKWLKVLVTDTRSGKETARMSLPLSVLEAVFKCAGDDHFRAGRKGCEVDLKALLGELKKAGPTTIFEVSEKDSTVRVWLE
jgi:hypothetical protein